MNYETTDYQNGILSFHFAFNPQSSERTINTTFRFQEAENCSNADSPITTNNLQLPETVNNFSVRFVANNNYQFFDDDTGTPISCDGCNIQFPGTSLIPGPYKAQFDLFTGNLDSSFSSTSQFIRDPSPVPGRTPVLVVPGIEGTEIYKGADLLWIDLSRATSTDGDAFLDPLAFNLDLTPLDTSLTIGNVIRRLNDPFTGLVTGLNYTEGLIDEFKKQGYTENTDLFTFPYDWRFSVEHNTVFLKNKIQHILDQTHAMKVDVIAHSTGGLIAKKYIMDNPEPKIEKLIFVGTPNLGAPKAAKVLIQGDSLGIPLLSDSEIKKIAHNMPVIYDLAPSSGYIDKAGSYISIYTRHNFVTTTTQDLDFDKTKSYLFNDQGLNSLAIAQAEQLHSSEFDNFDVRTKGVNAYNIVGCKEATIGRIIERRASPPLPFVSGFAIKYVPGDGTVPLASANNIVTDENKTFFATNVEHAEMLTADGTRQQIVKVITGDNSIDPGSNIQTTDSQCQLNGKILGIFSPVDIEIIDQDGNLAGLLEDGSISNDIPNAQFDIVDDHKFVYLPDDNNQQYTINLTGTDNGTFTLTADTIADNEVTSTSAYYDLPVTNQSEGHLDLSGESVLKFDEETYLPDAVLTPQENRDTTPPVTTAQMQATLNENGFYQTPVLITFVAQDSERGSTGVLRTVYTVDDGSEQIFHKQPVAISDIGDHTVRFYSLDRAGNREAEQVLNFHIENTYFLQ